MLPDDEAISEDSSASASSASTGKYFSMDDYTVETIESISVDDSSFSDYQPYLDSFIACGFVVVFALAVVAGILIFHFSFGGKNGSL